MSLTAVFLLAVAAGPVTNTATSTVGPDGDVVVVGEPLPVTDNGDVERVEPPDVDGRDPKGPSPGEALLWVPRVLFSPVYALWEYGIRRPTGSLLTWVEKNQVPLQLYLLFTFGPERKSGVFPTLLLDFGFRPSGGFFFFSNDTFIDGHDVRITGAYGGPNWFRGTYSSEFALSKSSKVGASFQIEQRPDRIFHGVGPTTLREDRSRFLQRTVNGRLNFTQELIRGMDLKLQFKVEENQFDINDTAFQNNDPSLGDALALGLFPQPAGLEGFFAFTIGADVRYDSRTDTRENGTGISSRVLANYSADINDPERRQWLNAAGGISGHLDLGRNRIIGLGGFAQHVFQFGDIDVPFTELASSGTGPLALGAFQPGRLLGNALAVVAAEYRYEVWAFMDGRLFAAVGNVFGENFGETIPGADDGFDVDLLRLSYGIGLSSIGDPDQSFNFVFALGHDTFEQGAGIDTVRVLVGFQPDF
ncbi:MAG: hypothetical protein ACFB9M_16605 [Myxococcota bacterium]